MLCGGATRSNSLVTVATIQSLAARYLDLNGPIPSVEGAEGEARARQPKNGGDSKSKSKNKNRGGLGGDSDSTGSTGSGSTGSTDSTDMVRVGRESERPPSATLVIIDEAHCALASTYLALADAYPTACLVGLTATPYRLDPRESLSQVSGWLVGGGGFHWHRSSLNPNLNLNLTVHPHPQTLRNHSPPPSP